MRWQRAARYVVAAIGVGTAVALFVLRREAPATARTRAEGRSQGPDLQDGGRPGDRCSPISPPARIAGDIEFESSQHYDDGRNRFDKAHLARFDDPPFELWADLLEARGRGVKDATLPGELVFTGHVRLKTKDGLELKTDRATYQDATGIVTMPGEVNFTKGRLSGRGIGATYNRDAQTFEFLDQAHADVAPDAQGKGAARATSTKMTMLRGSKMLRLDQKASIVTETETLAADVENLYFTDDEQSIRFLELRGHSSVMPSSASSGTPEMHADNITLTFHPDGRTLQHATLTDAGLGRAGRRHAAQGDPGVLDRSLHRGRRQDADPSRREGPGRRRAATGRRDAGTDDPIGDADDDRRREGGAQGPRSSRRTCRSKNASSPPTARCG